VRLLSLLLLQDGNNINNIITVLPADSTEALVTARLLSPTGAL
jgi:hypothetical protein